MVVVVAGMVLLVSWFAIFVMTVGAAEVTFDFPQLFSLQDSDMLCDFKALV